MISLCVMVSPSTQLTPDQLFPFLSPFLHRRWWIAFSGGKDSHVLLHCLVQLRDAQKLGGTSLHAVYVDHQLQADSKQWGEHCQQVCEQFNIPFSHVCVDAQGQSGDSPEAAARDARYQAFAELVQVDDCLLTAHHQDDQAETFLLQLFRGAGVRGLRAMPCVKPFFSGQLLRPLLGFSREQISCYADAHKLQWVEDSSNADLRFDRNFLRQVVLPGISERWPSVQSSIARSAGLCGDAELLLEGYLVDSLAELYVEGQVCRLRVDGLRAFDEVRQLAVLRQWLLVNFEAVAFVGRLPSFAQLGALRDGLLSEREDAEPLFVGDGYEVRRYQGVLYWVESSVEFDSSLVIPFSHDILCAQGVDVEGLGGCVVGSQLKGSGLRLSALQSGQLSLRFRQGGERFHPDGRQGSHPLKKLLQEAGVPPWERAKVPLLYVDETLVAVVGVFVAQQFVAKKNEFGIELGLVLRVTLPPI